MTIVVNQRRCIGSAMCTAVAPELFALDAATGKFVLHDRGGVPIRFYRWLPDAGDPPANIENYSDDGHTGLRAFLNTPWMVGNPEQKPELRSATYAIVAAGPDGLFGNELEMGLYDQNELMSRLGIDDPDRIFEAASADNIVVVGR